MRKSLSRTLLLATTLMFSGLGFATPSGDALLQECQAKAQGTADTYTAVMNCINEKLQYDSSSGD